MDPGLLATAIICLTIATLMFSLRVYVRTILIQKWGLDDWLITCAMIGFLIYCVTQIVGIYYGIGRRLTTINPSAAKSALLCWWLCELFYIPSTIFLKLSVGIFLHRLAIKTTHLYLIRFMMWASGLFGSAYLLLAIFQCRPISAWWVQKHDPPASLTQGRCFDNRTVVIVTFISCSLNAIADCVFGLLPIFMVKDLRMPRKQKHLVACILGFANIACVATIVRTPFTIKFFRDDEFLYETRTFALLSTIEPGVGIAAACTATLRPLLQRSLGRDASGWFSIPHPHPQGHRKAGGGSYTPGASPGPGLPTDVSSNYVEISATWRPPSPKHKARRSLITGKEMKHLVSSPTASEFHESFVLKSSEEHDGRFLPVKVEGAKSWNEYERERDRVETGTVRTEGTGRDRAEASTVRTEETERDRAETSTVRTDKTERPVGFTFFDEGDEG